MVQHGHEEELFNNLPQFETETTYNRCFDFNTLRQYILELYKDRIFDHLSWIGFVPLNRKYRPNFIKDIKFIKIKYKCRGAIGEITAEQIKPAGAPCPKCGRYALFTRIPNENQKTNELF